MLVACDSFSLGTALGSRGSGGGLPELPEVAGDSVGGCGSVVSVFVNSEGDDEAGVLTGRGLIASGMSVDSMVLMGWFEGSAMAGSEGSTGWSDWF